MSKRILLLLLLVCFIPSAAPAADNPFVGKWKLNVSKSRFPDQMKVKEVAANKYAFAFEGDDYADTIVADGTDQPGFAGTTFSIAPEDSHNWKVVRKQDGKLLITAHWKLSQDGNTLDDDFTNILPDGSKFNIYYVYQRTAPGPAFAGTWESTSEKVNSPFWLQIEPHEGDGLAFTSALGGTTKRLKLDGKDYPSSANGKESSSLRQIDPLTLEITDKADGQVQDIQEDKLSPDHKTLTVTVRIPGQYKPQVRVFDRE